MTKLAKLVLVIHVSTYNFITTSVVLFLEMDRTYLEKSFQT